MLLFFVLVQSEMAQEAVVVDSVCDFDCCSSARSAYNVLFNYSYFFSILHATVACQIKDR